MVVQLAQMWGNTENEDYVNFFVTDRLLMTTSIVRKLFILFHIDVREVMCVLVYNI